ncbi:MAG: GTP-binding protein [Eubacteriales bacterium]|nr:GTP-binding protein [Eubacteriales bacterium]
MKILIVSGFLGAGKTTFIKEMIRATGRDYVIFENEFGDVNIDGDVLRQAENELKSNRQTATENENEHIIEIREFTDGCICCNMKGDFTASLLTIQNTLQPDFLIIEPSGVGVLSSIKNGIRGVEYEHIRMLAPITIVDARTYEKNKTKYAEIFTDQIRSARFVQLSKTEQMSPDELAAIATDIRHLNPDAEIFTRHYKDADTAYWQALFQGELKDADEAVTPVDGSPLDNISFRDVQVRDLCDLIRFLNQLVLGFFGDVCRAKGVFNTPDGYGLRFDLVDGLYSITCAEDEAEADVVLIGTGLKKMLLRATFNSRFRKNGKQTVRLRNVSTKR